MGAAQVTLPPGSFLQATVAGEDALAALVSEHCKRAKHIADLFCGVGPFALRLAAKSRVAAFDSDAGAVDGAAEGGDFDVRAEAGQGARRATCSAVRWCRRNCATTMPSCSTRRARAPRRKSSSSPPARVPSVVARLLQRRDLRARREDPDRWRLQDRKRDAGGPVPPHAACGAGGAVQEVGL